MVADGNLIKITTSDNEEHVAQVIGRDPASEIAVLKAVSYTHLEPLAGRIEIFTGRHYHPA